MQLPRSPVVIAAAVGLVAAAGTVAVATRAQAAAGCKVDYAVSSSWSGGFGANVTITNLGDAINGWTLTWSFTAGQTITQLWNGSVTQSGTQVSVTNASYNAAIDTGASTAFGFNGTWTGSNPSPTAFTLNGVACTGTPTSPSSPATSPSSQGPSSASPSTSVPPGTTTTAWQAGQFSMDTPNLVRRSDIVLGRANTSATQFVPLGNGSLGAAVWAANGFTAQLNRNDTFPNRLSPGQVVIPGLSRLTGASDFKGHLDLYDGTLVESGGGMTLKAYIMAGSGQLVVDVTGADPNTAQTARVSLWSGRSPSAQASGSVATLSQTWTDSGAGASGRTFGAMAGISAAGRSVTASTPDSRTAQVSFLPNTDGSFRVITVCPTWTGGSAISTTTGMLGGNLTDSALASAHLSWWHTYWSSVGLIKITSGDGSGEYFENLRTLYLYDMAALNRDSVPGTQAGLADLFTFSQDTQPWYPAGYWFWNLRMFVQANLSAGAFGLNAPVFDLYRSNLANIQAWTTSYYPNHQGICVPETMRFNGNGSWYSGNESCDSLIAPSFNSQTVTSGAEISLWIWQTWLATDDRTFLSANYPVMRDTAKFLLSHAKTGSDGLLHTTSNAHENQWSVSDPITDVAAMKALFPVVVSAAQTLGVDSDLVSSLNAAIPKIRSYPTTTSGGVTVLTNSAQPTAAIHNVENLGLEPVWPYNLIGDSGSQTQLARDTYSRRPNTNNPDWTFDALQAARLGMASEVKTTLTSAVGKYQLFPSGMAAWDPANTASPYLEQSGVLAAALTEALIQDYDGTLRVAPAWPSDWSAEGTVFIQHQGRVHVQIKNGTLVTLGISAGAAGTITLRNPWSGQNVTVVDADGTAVLTNQTGATIGIPARAGGAYLVQRASAPTTALPFAAVSGSAATAARSYTGRTIGLPR